MSLAEELIGAMFRKDDDGSFHFAVEDVQRVLPWIVFPAIKDGGAEKLPAFIVRFLAEFISTFQLDVHDNDEAFHAALERYWNQISLNGELMVELQRIVRKHLVAKGPDSAATQNIARVLGVDPATLVPEAEREIPKGAVPASPMARFKLQED